MKKIVLFISALILATVLLFSSSYPVLADASTSNKEITALLDRYVRGWTKGDTKILKGMWDENYTSATYLPVESTEIIKGIDRIANYYDRTVGYFPVVAVDLKTPEIDLMGKYAHVSCNSDFTIADRDGSQTTLHPRLSFTMEQKGNQWYVIHYAESATVEG
jgi:uncharacterized protein (TIGR02246 family)